MVSEKLEKLGSIFLDIEQDNLYEALNAAFLDQISDFMKDYEYSRCMSESYITQPPNVFFFSLNRVQYNKQLKQLVKNNKVFKFEKVIYADAFMHKNKRSTKQMRKELQNTKEKVKLLTENLKVFENFTLSKTEGEELKSSGLLQNFKITESVIQANSMAGKGQG